MSDENKAVMHRMLDEVVVGKKLDIASITILRFEDGRLAERWNLVDRYGMLQQLGVIKQ